MQTTLYEIIEGITGKSDLILHDSTILDDLALDSLDRLDLHMKIEDAFDIEIPIEEFIGCKNLGDVLSLVSKKKSSE
jgi:acyl carrier protein